MISPAELQNIANAQGRGYLKSWKAASMVMTMNGVNDLVSDRESLRKFVANCLEMEGFSATGIDAVVEAIWGRLGREQGSIVTD